jgi:uncharacterized protein (TIGR03118 family)
MDRLFGATKLLCVAAFAVAVVPSLTLAQHYTQKNLVSDIAQPNNADGSKVIVDPNLRNPWGLTRSAGSPWWIGNNNSGTSSLYDGNGNPINIFPDPAGSMFDNFVFVPPPGFAAAGTLSTPTGVVFNGSPTDFLLDKGTPANKQAIFIFATEDGTISGWNPTANVASGAKPPSINAVLEVDNSDKGSSKGAVYKGATSAEINGKKFLYVTNFRSGSVEVYDTNFKPVHLGEDAFDPDGDGDFGRDDRDGERVPRGFAPFNIQNIGGSLFVTYAKQDAARHDPVGGDGLGFVEIFTPDGKHIGHLQHGSWMNAPWGVVWTPRDFGTFSNSILVGNFRSGWIAAFNGFTHKFEGFVRNPDNSLVFIDGLWSLTFGNNGNAGSSDTLFFTAGLNGEQDGLFGTLTPVPAEEDGSIE